MFNLSTQATIYLVVLVLTSIINIICISIAAGPLGFLAYTLYAIFAIPFFILYVYNIDCLTSGDCQIWSWVVAILSSISLLVTAVVIIYLTAVPPKTGTIFNRKHMPADEPGKFVGTPSAPTVWTVNGRVITPDEVAANTVATPVATTTTPAATTTTPAATTTTPAATTTTPATPATSAATSGLTDAQYNQQIEKEIQRGDQSYYEQKLRKEQYVSLQFVRKDLTREEKNELWRLQLEIEYAEMVNNRKNSQKYLLTARGLAPELREYYQNNLMILQRSILQREKMTVVYPPLLELGSLQIESIKLNLKLAIEQKEIIQQELLKPGLSNDEMRALQKQLLILEGRIALYNSQLNKN
jgi:hypothetical protein